MKIELQIIEKLKQYESLTISQIAEHLLKDLPAISKVITKLEKKGLIKKNQFKVPGTRAHKQMISLEKDNLLKFESDNLSKSKKQKKNNLSNSTKSEKEQLVKNESNNLSILENVEVDMSDELQNMMSEQETDDENEIFDNLSILESNNLLIPKKDNLSNSKNILLSPNGELKNEILRSLYMLYAGMLPKSIKQLKSSQLAAIIKDVLNKPSNFAKFLKNISMVLEMV